MKITPLIENLAAIGKPTETWTSPDGSRVLVLPYGGRVLGLFAPGQDENLLWTHSALDNPDSARDFYAGSQWHNSGGERTWLAPEVDFFFPKYPKLDVYFQQRTLDPGNYEVSSVGTQLRWTTRSKLSVSRTGQTIEVEIAKSLAPAVNPLRYEDDGAAGAGVSFAGYTLQTSLRLIGAERPPYIGLWQLLQLPHGGDMLVPTLARTEPKIYMGTIGSEDLLVEEQLVRYRMRASGEHKLGMQAKSLAGRAGYLYSSGDQWSLVVRNFFVDPSAEYVDVPLQNEQNFGFAFQACNVNSNLGAFSELEYHIPAIGAKAGADFMEDRSQVWAFRGPKAQLCKIAGQLVSAEVPRAYEEQ